MNEATRLMIETGIIPESAAKLCHMWNGDDDELPPAEMKKTTEELKDMVNKIVHLLEDKEEIPAVKESELDLEKLVSASHLKATLISTSNSNQPVRITTKVGRNVLGKLIIPVSPGRLNLCELIARKGNEVELSDGQVVMITGVEPRYAGNDLRFYVCDVVQREVG